MFCVDTFTDHYVTSQRAMYDISTDVLLLYISLWSSSQVRTVLVLCGRTSRSKSNKPVGSKELPVAMLMSVLLGNTQLFNEYSNPM